MSSVFHPDSINKSSDVPSQCNAVTNIERQKYVTMVLNQFAMLNYVEILRSHGEATQML